MILVELVCTMQLKLHCRFVWHKLESCSSAGTALGNMLENETYVRTSNNLATHYVIIIRRKHVTYWEEANTRIVTENMVVGSCSAKFVSNYALSIVRKDVAVLMAYTKRVFVHTTMLCRCLFSFIVLTAF